MADFWSLCLHLMLKCSLKNYFKNLKYKNKWMSWHLMLKCYYGRELKK